MRCPPCRGTGRSPFRVDFCPLCHGRATISDERINNPICVACRQTGLSPFRVGLCEICGGWTHLPGPPTRSIAAIPEIDLEALKRAVGVALEATRSVPKQILEPKPMKIFVSHADADKALAKKFAGFLKLGAGVSHKNIFLSSTKGAIRNGDFFVANILDHLNAANIVIALLSKEYFASHFCLAEAGAALARKKAGACDFFSFVVPPASFSDLDGMLHGVESGSILDLPIHGEMKDRIQAGIPIDDIPGSSVWDEQREEFLGYAKEAVSLYEAKDALSLITVNNYQWKHEPGSPDHKIYVNFKIRINLKNESNTPIHIESGTWESGKDGIPAYEPSQQLKWRLKEGDPEAYSLTVPAGSVFRTWVGLAQNTDAAECLKRSASKQTGTMHLHLKIGQHLINHDLRF